MILRASDTGLGPTDIDALVHLHSGDPHLPKARLRPHHPGAAALHLQQPQQLGRLGPTPLGGGGWTHDQLAPALARPNDTQLPQVLAQAERAVLDGLGAASPIALLLLAALDLVHLGLVPRGDGLYIGAELDLGPANRGLAGSQPDRAMASFHRRLSRCWSQESTGHL